MVAILTYSIIMLNGEIIWAFYWCWETREDQLVSPHLFNFVLEVFTEETEKENIKVLLIIIFRIWVYQWKTK